MFYFLPRLTTLSTLSEDQSDLSDLELIQHLNVDVIRLTKLLGGNLFLGAYKTCVDDSTLRTRLNKISSKMLVRIANTEDPDQFFRSSLVCVYAVCLAL